jgi:hypothetical protein
MSSGSCGFIFVFGRTLFSAEHSARAPAEREGLETNAPEGSSKGPVFAGRAELREIAWRRLINFSAKNNQPENQDSDDRC